MISVIHENDDDNDDNSHTPVRGNLNSIRPKPSTRTVMMPVESETLQGFKSFYGHHNKQYTILEKKKYVSNIFFMDVMM